MFTWFPTIWAADGKVMNADGTASLLGDATATKVYDTWRDLWKSGAVLPSSKDEAGPTWTAGFTSGKVGLMFYPATLLASTPFDAGVAGIPGPGGGASTFVGGDGIGISKDSKNAAQAWNFLNWMMSEDAQVGVLAKDNDVVSRSDLANNQYASKDPRLVTINEIAAKGETPVALNFQQAFNAPNSPWLALVRHAVLGDGSNSRRQGQITSVLGPGEHDLGGSRAWQAVDRPPRERHRRRVHWGQPPAGPPVHHPRQMAGAMMPTDERVPAPAVTWGPARRPGRRRRSVLGWMYAAPTALFVPVLFVVPLLLVMKMSVSKWPLLSGNQGLNFPDNFSKAYHNRFFADSVWFTLKYTVLATVLLIGLGLGLALLVQESSRWQGFLRTAFLVPGALGLASASLLFYVLYSPFAGPFTSEMRPWASPSSGRPNAALFSTLFLIVWRFAGFYMLLMLVGLQGIPASCTSRRVPTARRPGRPSAGSPCRCCARPSPSPRCCASPGRCSPSTSSTS